MVLICFMIWVVMIVVVLMAIVVVLVTIVVMMLMVIVKKVMNSNMVVGGRVQIATSMAKPRANDKDTSRTKIPTIASRAINRLQLGHTDQSVFFRCPSLPERPACT